MEIFKQHIKKRRPSFIYLHQQKNRGNIIPWYIFPHFLQDIAAVYPRYGKEGLRSVAYSSNQKIEVSSE